MKVAANSAKKFPNTTKLEGYTGGYQTNYSQQQADECREVYLQYFKIAQAVSQAAKMGIVEMTLRTPTGSVTIPMLDPRRTQNLHIELQEMLGDKLEDMEKDILNYEKEAQNELEDQDGTSGRAQLFAHCLPMRLMLDAEFAALPAEARRAYDERRAESMSQSAKGDQAA